MSRKTVGVKLQSSGWCGSKSRSSGGWNGPPKALAVPGAGGQGARPLDRDVRLRVIRVERIAVGVSEQQVRSEVADPRGERGETGPVDLERVVAEVEALERRAERRRGALRLARADLLDALDRHPRLLPELARLALLAVGECEHARRAPGRGRDRDRAARPPDEVGRVRPDDEHAPAHESPASRRDCPTTISWISSSPNPAPSR